MTTTDTSFSLTHDDHLSFFAKLKTNEQILESLSRSNTNEVK